ncbi:hypothetical protein GCM10027073_48660 [Streptomyces chlorus]
MSRCPSEAAPRKGRPPRDTTDRVRSAAGRRCVRTGRRALATALGVASTAAGREDGVPDGCGPNGGGEESVAELNEADGASGRGGGREYSGETWPFNLCP